MPVLTAAELAWLAAGIAGSLLLGAVLGGLPWWLFATAVAALLWQLRQRWRFARWAARPLRRPRAFAPGWQEPVEDVYQSLQSGRTRTRTVLERVAELQTVTDALPDAAVVIDARSAITRFNPAAASLLRLTARDIGRDLLLLVRDPNLASLLDGKREDNVLEIASPFVTGARLEVRVIAVSDSTRLVLVRDVSQLNRLLTMRQDFVANVSHELRTPLTVISGYLETLIEEDLSSAEIQLLAGKLSSPVRRMEALVVDLLLLTRLEASNPPQPAELEPVDVRALAASVLHETDALATDKHRFDVVIEPGCQVLGVLKELHSALSNLVVNALRYSPEGGLVRIEFSHTAQGARLAVSDEGMGIAPEHISRLTERFYRVDFAAARVRGGTGLGLAIVKHVLKRHNANLTIDSVLGQGSRFCCEFPPSQLSREARPSASEEPAALPEQR